MEQSLRVKCSDTRIDHCVCWKRSCDCHMPHLDGGCVFIHTRSFWRQRQATAFRYVR